MVRGQTYTSDGKIKKPSAPCAYRLLGIDLLQSTGRLSHASAHPNSFTNRLRREKERLGEEVPFVLVVNFMLPWGNFIAYFTSGTPSPLVGDSVLDGLLRRFFLDPDTDDAFRDRRLKVIPRCTHGPWVVRQAVGSTPAIIGRKITQQYHNHCRPPPTQNDGTQTAVTTNDNYFEIAVDVNSSRAAQYILSVVHGFINNVSVELAFVIQGEEDHTELPERILAALRFDRVSVANAPEASAWFDNNERFTG